MEGGKTSPEITVYALSTCAFCKKGMEYLKQKGYAFRYTNVDEADVEVKREVKRQLADRFEVVAVFPILVVNNEKAFPGFTELIWSRAIGAA